MWSGRVKLFPTCTSLSTGRWVFLCFLPFFSFFSCSIFSLQQSTSVWISASKYKEKTKQPFSPFLLWLFGLSSAQSNVSEVVMREPRRENVNVHDVAFFYHIKRQRLICGALFHMASTLHGPFPPHRASSRCFHCLWQHCAVSFIFARRWKQTSANSLSKCGLADAASKCSCILSAVGHLGYCRFQQMMRAVRASSGGKWYREVIYWLSLFNHRDNKCCFIPFTLTIKLCALASSPPQCELFFVIHKVLMSTIIWTLLAHAHARNNRCIYLRKRFVTSQSSFASLWLRAGPWYHKV